ncbi:unnamed protein product [Haemonchus placei]|uniref:Octapeptide-repeat protein T2-like n=1 Tax=Haemonchus placei TaxID=6290 RepID=A0A0N4X5T1_HAEPC|nr:unnamed protein product [Haemonchus placei]
MSFSKSTDTVEAQRSKMSKLPLREERNQEKAEWRQRQRNSGNENKEGSGRKEGIGVLRNLRERGSARGSKGPLNKEVMERRKGTGSRDEVVRKEAYGSKSGFGSRGGIGSRERVVSLEGTNEELGSKEALGSKEELGSREGIGNRERVGSKEKTGSKEGAENGEELGSREDVVSGDAIGIREVDSPEGSGTARLHTTQFEGIFRDESEKPNSDSLSASLTI